MPEPSDFRSILRGLVQSVPGAWGAIFVDWEGESVDLYATSSEYEVKLAGAEIGLLLTRLVQAGEGAGVERTSAGFVRTQENDFFVHMLDQEYFVLLATKPNRSSGLARRKLAEALESLRRLV